LGCPTNICFRACIVFSTRPTIKKYPKGQFKIVFMKIAFVTGTRSAAHPCCAARMGEEQGLDTTSGQQKRKMICSGAQKGFETPATLSSLRASG
jgi:hypothetical protein